MNDDHDWPGFMQGQLLFALLCGSLLGLILLGAELLHSVSGGRVPPLIEHLIEWQPPPRYKVAFDDDDAEENEEIDDDDERGDAALYWKP